MRTLDPTPSASMIAVVALPQIVRNLLNQSSSWCCSSRLCISVRDIASSLEEYAFVVNDASAALPSLSTFVAESVTAAASVSALNLEFRCFCDSYWVFDLHHVVTSFSTFNHGLTAHASLPTLLLCKLKGRLQSWIFRTVFIVGAAIA